MANKSKRGFLAAGLVGVGLTKLHKSRADTSLPERRSMEAAILAAGVKPQMYSQNRVSNARRLVATGDKNPWALLEWTALQRRTERFRDWPLENLLTLFRDQSVPRGFSVDSQNRSPSSGRPIVGHGAYPWKFDAKSHPWQLQDPTTDIWHNGDPASNANGWMDRGTGIRWNFTAYFNHWAVWYGPNSIVGADLPMLAKTCLLDDSEELLSVLVTVLGRISQIYPGLDIAKQGKSLGLENSDGASGKGIAVGRIWECDVARAIVIAVDALASRLDRVDETQWARLKERKTLEMAGLPDDIDPVGAATRIASRLIPFICEAILESRILGNFGMHQAVLLHASCLFKDVNIASGLDAIVRQRGVPPSSNLTGLVSVEEALGKRFGLEGFGREGAPGYNQTWTSRIGEIVRISEADGAGRIAIDRRIRQILISQEFLLTSQKYYPSIGDSGELGRPIFLPSTMDLLVAYKYTEDERIRALIELRGAAHGTTDGEILFEEWAANHPLVRDKGSAEKKLSEDSGRSLILPDLGFVRIRLPSTGGRSVSACLTFMQGGHAHRDGLSLSLYADGLDALPDLGYPSLADRGESGANWARSTLSHNTTSVDGLSQNEKYSSQIEAHWTAPNTAIAAVKLNGVFAGATTYRRTIALLSPGDGSDDYCLVDMFELDGPGDHLISYHGLAPKVALYSEKPRPLEDLRSLDDHPTCLRECLPEAGFNALKDTRTWDRSAESSTCARWLLEDHWGAQNRKDESITLGLAILSPLRDVTTATGMAPRSRKGGLKELGYLFGRASRREGATGRSIFLGLLSTHSVTSGRPWVSAAHSVSKTGALTLSIQWKSGRKSHLIVNAKQTDETSGAFGRLRGRYAHVIESATATRIECMDCERVEIRGIATQLPSQIASVVRRYVFTPRRRPFRMDVGRRCEVKRVGPEIG